MDENKTAAWNAMKDAAQADASKMADLNAFQVGIPSKESEGCYKALATFTFKGQKLTEYKYYNTRNGVVV